MNNKSNDPRHLLIVRRVQQAIRDSGMQYCEIAERAGISTFAVSSYMFENPRTPSAESLAALCPVLGVRADWLLGLNDPPNEPLTLEELKEMDGEPVWVQYGDGRQGWTIVEDLFGEVALYGPQFGEQELPPEEFINMEYEYPAGHFGLHGLGWRAYRRRP